jgi:tetratricopeptide (TPR) repeat protein
MSTYSALRALLLVVGGVVVTLVTGNLWPLAGSVVAFVALFVMLKRYAVADVPRWETLLKEGRELGMKGDWPEAVAKFQQSLAGCRADGQRRIASEQIGLFLFRANRPGDAEPYLREAVRLTTRAFGPMATRTVTLRDQLSDLYVKSGQAWQAADLQKQALVRAEPAKSANATLGSADTAARYAEALQLSGNAAEAEAYNQKALESLEKADPKSPMYVRAVVSASRYAASSGDRARAIDLLNKALDNATSDTPPKIVDDARATLVTLYTDAQRYEDAIKVLELRIARRSGLDPSRNAEMQRELADLFEKSGQPDAAAKHRRVAETLEGMISAAGHKS